jgi:hypothetical protein
MLDPRADVGDDLGELRLAIPAAAVDEHPHRVIVFPDAVDPAGQLEFGAERGLEESFRDLAVGERLLLGALARGDGRDFGGGSRRHDDVAECDGKQSERNFPRM